MWCLAITRINPQHHGRNVVRYLSLSNSAILSRTLGISTPFTVNLAVP